MNMRIGAWAAGLAMAWAGAAVAAQGFPDRPITLVVPFAAGASADGIGRVLAQELSTSLGQPVIVRNQPGGGGAVGLMAVAHSQPDGYTLGLGATGAIAINPHIPNAAPLKPNKDLAPVAKLADVPLVIVAGKRTGYKNLKDMLDKARAHPQDPIIFGTPGQYTAQHLSGELLARMAGIRMNAVPYRGSGPAVTDLLGGQIGVAVVDLTSAYPHIKTGDLVALGTTGARRSAVAPELPTIAEGGVAGYDAPAWMGLFAPAGIPPAAADKVSAAVKAALAQPEVRKRLINLAAEPDYMGPQDFSRFIARESNRWEQLLKSINQR
ncbi:tripartite tricarboxylate transporter substrate binding protein [Candidimonas humi]|uniref:Bug family tripartite tricarboxylate transporter substrate binding protein n=1 Tax=Candidimonas humi TaxID=683355 RepID=A0ABV8NYN0_9BURK|nr:tripartite tricarboxylate transporter substrate binding protein [Candidimonas humi]MBV6304634.1 tripartite tricarboxylate transporter substrate binding protein [Candidimonas humi]